MPPDVKSLSCGVDKSVPDDKGAKAKCKEPPPKDSVIPMVFPDYLITVEKKDFGLSDRLAIKMLPGVYVQSENDKEVQVAGLGHAGVLIINGTSGATRYFEYGRYDKGRIGLVREREVKDVSVDATGKPTKASLNAALKDVSEKAGKSGKVLGVRIEAENKYDAMVAFALERLKENDNPNRTAYAIRSHNCFTFAVDVAGKSGADVSAADKMFPVSSMNELRKKYENVDYSP
jgi:hypothetical protein